MLGDAAIMPIYIRSELQPAILPYPRGEITDQYGYRPFDPYTLLFAFVDDLVYLLFCPSLFIPEQPDGETGRIRDPDTAMTVGPAMLMKEIFVRRIMQVDIKTVGEEEFDPSELVPGAG
jgi:hypothetical protein